MCVRDRQSETDGESIHIIGNYPPEVILGLDGVSQSRANWDKQGQSEWVAR